MPQITSPFPLLVLLALCTSAAVAQRGPERIPVLSGFVPTDDGAYRVVILTQDSVGEKPIPIYCGARWSYGMIQSQHRSAAHNNAIVINPTGCWAESDPGLKSGQIIFRYFDIEAGQRREFRIDPTMLRNFSYEWRSQRLFLER